MPVGVPIRNKAHLVDFLHQGGKDPGKWGVGLEYEQVGLSFPDLRPLPFSGPASITSVLEGFYREADWNPNRENTDLIGLEKEGARITLEPGGQLELSGRVHSNLVTLRKELSDFQRNLRAISDPQGISWLAIGLHPFAKLSEIPWMPKERYRILSAYLADKGTLSHNMMKQTAGVQVNLDYHDEADAMEKFRVAMGLTSIVTAIFANSSVSEGKLNGFATRRAYIWLHTDSDRCGLLRFAFEPGLSFERYVEYAMQVPSLFLVRKKRWAATGGVSFGSLLESGWQGRPLQEKDWAIHLTSLFPEVRLKKYLEIRSSDSTTVPRAIAFAALWMGILYHPESRRSAWKLVEGFTWEERTALHERVCRLGLEARTRNRTVRELAQQLLALAHDGVSKLGLLSSAGPNFLKPAQALVDGTETSPAGMLAGDWERGQWANRPRDIARLFVQ